MQKLIMGLDIGKAGFAVGICLSELPPNLLDHFYKLDRRKDFYRFTPCRDDVNKFLSLGVTGVVMEPTGSWYSAFWFTLCQRKGIEVNFISHARLKAQRGHFGFTNKTDEEDALVLAACYFDEYFRYPDGSKRFLKDYNPLESRSIRDLTLEIEQLDKIRGELVSQLRQRLSFEYPESASQHWQREPAGITPIIAWLTGERNKMSVKRDRHYQDSVSHSLGIELSSYTRNHAQLIYTVESQLTDCERDLSLSLKHPRFEPYTHIFSDYGFGLGMQGLLIYKIFPFEKFLLEDGTPWVIEKTRDDGKIIKLDKSRAAFQSYLGLSKKVEQSGDGIKTKWNGSSLIRSHLYIWCFATICRKQARGSHPKRAILGKKFDDLSSRGIKGKDAIIRCCYALTSMLYSDLSKM